MMLEQAAFILTCSRRKASCSDISLEAQKHTAMTGTQQPSWEFIFQSLDVFHFSKAGKIYRVSALAVPAHICIFIVVFLEISTPRPDLG